MKPTDQLKFAKIMYTLAGEYQGTPTAENLEMKFKVLLDMKIEEIQTAARHIINTRTATYPNVPTVSEIRQAFKDAGGVSAEDGAMKLFLGGKNDEYLKFCESNNIDSKGLIE